MSPSLAVMVTSQAQGCLPSGPVRWNPQIGNARGVGDGRVEGDLLAGTDGPGGGKGDRGQFRRRHIGLGAFNGEAEVDVLEGRRAGGQARVVAGGVLDEDAVDVPCAGGPGQCVDGDGGGAVVGVAVPGGDGDVAGARLFALGAGEVEPQIGNARGVGDGPVEGDLLAGTDGPGGGKGDRGQFPPASHRPTLLPTTEPPSGSKQC